ncbi:aminotransferase-like domain-containing protein [Roseateles koreensis]|uniref:PLP-dependent aminotransferase family protein n=1 Tax=Roseateles koreensis TaxID=2987526 RepID=A0ABT5KT78_9BURK|nr:PLP-dependent aminotransferase family protein [Roseateles koreensis]MDC8786124.1 PLP-dependent aminotransferase family protein [Roseateles koreensis]
MAKLLAAELQAGAYPPGTRLPSVRQLCEQHGASLATVTHALHELEDAGLIAARPRRGFFALAAARPKRPASAAVAIELAGRRKRLMALAATQSGCLSLGHLALPAELLPLRPLSRLLTQLLRSDAALMASGTVYGTAELREQLALRGARMACPFDAEDIVVTQGWTESLELCLRLLCKPGDSVAVASPAPLRALELLAQLDLQVVEIPASAETGLAVPALAFAQQHQRITACLVEPTFDCATGSLMSDAAKQDLAELAARHGLAVIECDMMGELHAGPQRPRPLKAFDRDERVLYCGSFACITGPGCSLGYIVSGRYRLQLRAARTVHGELLPLLTDQLLTRFMASGGLDAHLRRLRQRLAAQRQAYVQAVLSLFPSGTRVSKSAGSYLLWLELPPGLDACTLLEQARHLGYTFVPGAVFSTGHPFDHCLRLSARHPLDEAHLQGIRVLGELAAGLLER